MLTAHPYSVGLHRNHYQEAIEIYKKELAKSKDNHALDVYIALCYYKLDYYDVSQVGNCRLVLFFD